ncbi:MAG: ribosome-associated translation inhibitor RaiA [Verrucomicrobiales bacterium]
MQIQNANVKINVIGRHVEVSDAMREYALKKVESLHLDYPKIIEARVILDVQAHHNRHIAEILLFCANHITIEAHSETYDMYASIDETTSKIARRMRKRKTRLLKKHRPRKGEVSNLPEAVFAVNALDALDEVEDGSGVDAELEPVIVHKENYRIRPLFNDEAMVDMELSERDFLVFKNAESGRLSILFRRKDGDYGLIEPEI